MLDWLQVRWMVHNNAEQLPASAADAVWRNGWPRNGWSGPTRYATAPRDAPWHDACRYDATANVHAATVRSADVPCQSGNYPLQASWNL